MRLTGKNVLVLITDGVEEGEYAQLCAGLRQENAAIFTTSPQQYLSVESVNQGRRGRDITVDLPFEAVADQRFDALMIPDGLLSTGRLLDNPEVLELIFSFHQQSLPIFASGSAVRLLHRSRVLSDQIVVREGTPMEHFLDQAVGVLLDGHRDYFPSQPFKYRPTI